MSETEVPLRREFTEEFKREAVRLANERGNLCQTARDLGVHESVLGRWKRALAEESRAPAPVTEQSERSLAAFAGKGNPRDEELAKLQREVRRLKEENEILKNRVPALAGGGVFTSRPT
jgi:transposase